MSGGIICPHCHKDWWLYVANDDEIVCGCGFQYYAPQPEPTRAAIRLAYPADQEHVVFLEPRLCACGRAYTPNVSTQHRCHACTREAHRIQGRESSARWRERQREQKAVAHG